MSRPVRGRPRPGRAHAARVAAELRQSLTAIGLCMVMGGLLTVVAVHISAQADAVQAAQGQIAALTGQTQQLEAQLAALESPARIEYQAITRLGLERPAAYVPVPEVPVVIRSRPQAPPTSALEVLPVAPGPVPGSVVSLWRVARHTLTGLWRRVAG